MRSKTRFSLLLLLCLALPLPYLTGCGLISRTEADAQSEPRGGGATAVDVAVASTEALEESLEYTGTTQPVREVSLRSQAEGRLLNLNVDAGDGVRRGQILARLDDALLVTAVSEADAELAALRSEVARAEAQVGNAQARAEQARLELKQAEADATRLQRLAAAGAISEQEAELAQTAAATARANLNSALKQIGTEEQAVAAAKGRVAAQQATVAQNRERQSYALLASPINGVVLERVTEPGNLVTPGSEVLKLGDFSQVKVVVPVSELELADIRIGQAVTVRLDAFANETFPGKVTRISPAADPVARQVPVEVTIPNSNNRIGSGLLARVSFAESGSTPVVVPQTALQGEQETATVFVVTGNGNEATVTARAVQIGDRANGKVEILSGLQPGERFVARSARPLQDGDSVRLSVLSET
jgi:multidrug efflux pump subunit AcrA (membrane-fusion protein)